MEADCRLRRIPLLNDLSIGDLAQMVKCRPLSNAAESLVAHIRKFVANFDEDLLFDRHDLVAALDQALDGLHQQHVTAD